MARWLIVVGLSLAVAAALFLRTFSAAPLAPPPVLEATLPAASPASTMAVFQLPTGVTHRSAAFAYRGGAFGDKRDFGMVATLVRHPRGDLLIDTGFGRQIDTQFQLMPLPFRVATGYQRFAAAADQLEAAGYDRSKLRAILLTHAHWDHISGVPDFPGTPVWVTPEERRFIDDGGMVTVVARSCREAHFEEYTFDGGPYLGFPRSHDVYGDGAIVVVPAPGHTPGSVIVFLTLPDGKRYALIGDLTWQLEGISQREERPWLQRSLADVDPGGVRDNILHMAAIAARFPDMIIVPAHDTRGFALMPKL